MMLLSLTTDSGSLPIAKQQLAEKFPVLKTFQWEPLIPAVQGAGSTEVVEYLVLGSGPKCRLAAPLRWVGPSPLCVSERLRLRACMGDGCDVSERLRKRFITPMPKQPTEQAKPQVLDEDDDLLGGGSQQLAVCSDDEEISQDDVGEQVGSEDCGLVFFATL